MDTLVTIPLSIVLIQIKTLKNFISMFSPFDQTIEKSQDFFNVHLIQKIYKNLKQCKEIDSDLTVLLTSCILYSNIITKKKIMIMTCINFTWLQNINFIYTEWIIIKYLLCNSGSAYEWHIYEALCEKESQGNLLSKYFA